MRSQQVTMQWYLGKKGVNKMTDEYLFEHGYKKYQPTTFDNECVVARFQKRFDDDFGKKYFIDILRWSNDYIPISHRGEDWELYSYEYEMHFSMYSEEKSLNITLFNSWTLEEVEIFAENFFNTMKPNYYENWDEERRVRPQ